MRRVRRIVLGLMAVALPASFGATPQQPKSGEVVKKEAVPLPVEAIDARGEPKPAALKATPGPKVCLGYERDGWQVQLRPGNADWTRIDGSIEVVGGEIARVSGFADLETAIKGKKNEHADQGKFDKRHIDFKVWVKKGGTDTFRFYLTDEVQTLRCRFRISGQVTTDSVLIGRDGHHPSRGDFALQAHPEAPGASDEAKSKSPRQAKSSTGP